MEPWAVLALPKDKAFHRRESKKRDKRQLNDSIACDSIFYEMPQKGKFVEIKSHEWLPGVVGLGIWEVMAENYGVLETV